jgi:hypothetical protein
MFELNSNPWDVLESEFPAMGTPAEQLRFLLNYAFLAPSRHNAQPWLFKVDGDTVELYADRSRSLPVMDPDDRELTIGCGAALANFIIAIRHFGYTPVVEIHSHHDQPRLLARVTLEKGVRATPEEQRLFSAILQRGTNRQPFEDRPVLTSLLSALYAPLWSRQSFILTRLAALRCSLYSGHLPIPGLIGWQQARLWRKSCCVLPPKGSGPHSSASPLKSPHCAQRYLLSSGKQISHRWCCAWAKASRCHLLLDGACASSSL